jgi:transposase
MPWLTPFFPRARYPAGARSPRAERDHRRIRHGLQWRDAPSAYGPHMTLCNRFVRLSRMGVFDRIFVALAAEAGPLSRLTIDATHLKAHRTAASLRKKGRFPVASVEPRAG